MQLILQYESLDGTRVRVGGLLTGVHWKIQSRRPSLGCRPPGRPHRDHRSPGFRHPYARVGTLVIEGSILLATAPVSRTDERISLMVQGLAVPELTEPAGSCW